MSEPHSAFFELRIPRRDLVRWLDAPVRPIASWSDWRAIGGDWLLSGGSRSIESVGDAQASETIACCDRELRGLATNREAVRWILDHAEAPYLGHCSYDDAGGAFVAGTLTLSDNLTSILPLFAVARSAGDALEPGSSGVAVVHNYIWAPETMRFAMRLAPGSSRFVDASEIPAAVARFQPIADGMLAISDALTEDDEARIPDPVDMLDGLG